MDIRLAIIDDILDDRENLKNGLSVFHTLEPSVNFLIKEFDSGSAFLNEYDSGAFSIVFLDIQMPGINGIESANRLRHMDSETLIVFCSTSREYAFDAFPIHPFDYLVKPYTQDRLNSVLSEMIRVVSKEEPVIEIRIPRDTILVPLKSIISASSHGHSVDIVLDDGNKLVSTMKYSELEKQLLVNNRFLSCNRGIIINMDHVRSLDGDLFRMKNGSAFPLKIRERSKIVSHYTKYMLARVNGGRK